MNTNIFASRHIGVRPDELPEMLESIGVESLGQLIYETIPNDIQLDADLNLPPALSEYEFANHIQNLAQKNKVFKSYIGLGYHEAILPAVIQRNVLENPGWYTAYTPYQAEIAQGRLEALLNFQTMISDLTGMELPNASLLDEATSAAEAMTLLYAVRSKSKKKAKANKYFVSEEVLPQTLALLQTRAEPLEIELVIGNHENFDFSEEFFGAVLQYPGVKGKVYDYEAFCKKAIETDIKIAVGADILSLVELEAPGDWGVDVVYGTTQRFGIPLGYGGPHAAYFATKEEYKRNIPGRIIGVTKDLDGNPSLRMALQTREQHIKRDRATSNICTAQVLLAVMASFYAVYHGPKGLKFIANQVHKKAVSLANQLEKFGIYQENELFFDTISLKTNAKAIEKVATANGINFYYPDEETVVISINETTSVEDLNSIIAVFAEALQSENKQIKDLLPSIIETSALKRTTAFLTHEVFNSFHSETSLMRYIKRLERKDLALNHSMISLGSCTMKLNAASEMLPLSNPQWGNIHPFVPVEQAAGYHEMLNQLEDYLTEITGFSATSLQPNSGAQGEFAGLMVIKAYHEANNHFNRNICLVPSSAHGTNPASAVMAGMKVVVVKATDKGNIDIEDLKAKAEKHSENLAALMVTYPSTHGVFESSIKEITGIIHEHGGQVYMDGANMNAQVGLTSPGKIGADVCHLNLHKTFAIPHGGGGPGVGPICVAKQLVPFLPSNPVVKTGGTNAISAISAAPWGSALVCLISYAYIRMLGAEGLKSSTEYAILNANYVKAKLNQHYPSLYSGERGRAAHEMIIDCRDFKKNGIEVKDIAKRLIDYGFHAPTVSFPVAGTMMIEPTESEGKAELDRFCEAMISIREEINTCTKEEKENILTNAPHTQTMLTSDHWDFSYTRKQAAFPLPFVEANKFWPSTRRVDEAYGDRNLMCTCAPIEDYIME
ncbi:aminomethyl-transferring glycine dehydrogenase [Psychroflexus planctonicus]|uniref:glycine dehydrogenase (aminomethyl-transferring) n=1 Tax=Psychroflexus planctonicus TaxID=1526575 RepID=A0ABQ1SNB7_9FLAO|nr:aminomethyl-transferring glycine dehydrogenase [Psychroflexus planctonicus]GGE44834.1 glycine dehydrogenase (aminomethyl-transferring) [Psychroflexus planctonicus]